MKTDENKAEELVELGEEILEENKDRRVELDTPIFEEALTWFMYVLDLKEEDIKSFELDEFEDFDSWFTGLNSMVDNAQAQEEPNLDKDEVLVMIKTLEHYREGSIERMFAYYSNNVLVKFKGELKENRESLSNMSLEEISLEFKKLVKSDNNVTVINMLNSIFTDSLTKDSSDAELSNLNSIKFDNTLVALFNKNANDLGSTVVYINNLVGDVLKEVKTPDVVEETPCKGKATNV